MTNYEKYKAHCAKLADLQNASALLQWDQETYMPAKSANKRAQQLSTLAGIVHELSSEESFGVLLNELSKDASLSEKEKRNVVQSKKDFDKSLKYSTAFVQELSKSVSEAFQAWQKAKKEDNFSHFAPKLEKLIELKRKECQLIGFKEHPYDVLLNEFEPGSTSQSVSQVFDDLKPKLKGLLTKIENATQNSEKLMQQNYPFKKQWDLGLELLAQMGYDFDAGRQDVSTHPFTTSFSPQDVRITTRINENDLSEMIWSCIHEGGHALYEQGLPDSEYGLPSGSYLSLGIHESQSRLWENNVGRSFIYWEKNFDLAKSYFPEQLEKYSAFDFFRAMNVVKPSLIRTSADELTYHFHVIIRFEIEKALIEGSIEVADLPHVWNSKYKDYLNIDVPNNTKGVLQDIHWSHGSFGYFPTYSLGSMYAAQFFHQAQKEIPNLEKHIKDGNHQPLLNWLRINIHQHGRTYSADELCIKVTGEKLNAKFFMEYTHKKYSELYNLGK